MRIPSWLEPLVDAVRSVRAEDLSRFLPPDDEGRASAVLILVGDGPAGPDVLLIERAQDLRSHAGQPAFPGGRVDDRDADVVEAALREAEEETGLDPSGVDVLATLPALWLPASGHVVTPVLGWWREPSPVRVVDPEEVARVVRVPVAELVEPANRRRVRHGSGFHGPAFEAGGMFIWGFTAGLLDRLLDLAGWSQPWDDGELVDLPVHVRAAVMRDWSVRTGTPLPGPVGDDPGGRTGPGAPV